MKIFRRKKILGDIGKEDLVADILRVAKKDRSMTVTRARYKRKGRYAIRQCYKKFGSWNTALRTCGLGTWNDVHKTRSTQREVGDKLRLAVFLRDNFKCVYCGASPSSDAGVTLHVDHVVPYSKGGFTEIGNLQTLCSKCNWGKGGKPLASLRSALPL